MNVEVGVMHLQVKEHQKLLPNSQKWGELHRTNSLLELLGGTEPTDTLISDFQPQNCEIVNFAVGAIQFVGLCYSSPIKLIQWYHTHGANMAHSPISCLHSSLVKESQPITGYCVIWNIAIFPASFAVGWANKRYYEKLLVTLEDFFKWGDGKAFLFSFFL